MARQLLMLLGACLQGDTSYAHAASLQMHAAVAGLGPAFKIKLTLQNTGTSVVRHLPVVRHGGIVRFQVRAHAGPPPYGVSACGSCWKPLSHRPLKQPIPASHGVLPPADLRSTVCCSHLKACSPQAVCQLCPAGLMTH